MRSENKNHLISYGLRRRSFFCIKLLCSSTLRRDLGIPVCDLFNDFRQSTFGRRLSV